MLNGIAPVLIYTFKKNIYENINEVKIGFEMVQENVPLLKVLKEGVLWPPIPIYLDERLYGLIVESEQKIVSIGTERNITEDKENEPEQNGITNNVTISLKCKKDNPLMLIMSAFADQIWSKIKSKEYSLSYISGFNTIFNGYLEEFSVDENDENNLAYMKIKIGKKPKDEKKQKATSTFNAIFTEGANPKI